MNTRRTLAAFAAASALALPVVLAAPASAEPPSNCPTRCDQTPDHPGNGSLVHVGVHAGDTARVNVNIGGGDCESDKLLLLRIRIDASHAHQGIADAQRADHNAQAALTTAQANYDAGYAAWTPLSTVVKSQANYQATPGGAALYQALLTAQSNATAARNHLNTLRENARVLDAKISLLTGRINGTECVTVTPTPTPTPTATPVPLPTPTDTPAPVIINNPPPAQVIVPGPTTVYVPGPSQVGQAPQSYVSAGGGADAAEVAGFSS